MDEPQKSTEVTSKPGTASVGSGPSKLFAGPPQDPPPRGKIIGVAIVAAAVAVIAIALSLRGGKATPTAAQNKMLPADPYAPHLVLTQLAMSESTSLSGGKSTFIDGRVKNSGPDTVTAVTMQVLFRNDVDLAPQVEMLPLTLIRTHEPYIDTEPVSVAPLKPGDDAEFRLIVEIVNANWNQQMPELLVVRVAKR